MSVWNLGFRLLVEGLCSFGYVSVVLVVVRYGFFVRVGLLICVF